ncbi:hypothetical protein SSX86_006495 [Deinandra increscens subsp. villosa]|uniref:Wall-associated receptor kinase galacturonan-binding domain-containing protein n=1 Tax=Deinandra increscens subsp. villosa TaxID=3103831 RepID=A0AAP0DEY4_9ASTR
MITSNPFILSLCLLTLIAHSSSSNIGCPKCGTIDVPYPLSTHDNCGNQKYKVYCNITTGLEFISATGINYKIISIDSKSHRLVLRPPVIQKDTCESSDLHAGGFRLEDESRFNISSRNTVMLFNCSNNILLSPLDCSTSSICRQFEKVESVCVGLLCCSYLKDSSMTNHQIRVRVDGCTSYTSMVDMKPSAPIDSWNFGIELQWLAPFLEL